ncbi:hypothetical protein [Streptomyces sp. NPDC057382]
MTGAARIGSGSDQLVEGGGRLDVFPHLVLTAAALAQTVDGAC